VGASRGAHPPLSPSAVSATTAPTPAPPPPFKPGAIPRSIAAFSGAPGLAIKIVLLATTNALGLYAASVLATRHHWVALPILVAATAAIDLVYLAPRRRTLPLKFLVPGTVFLVAFQMVPIIYTIEIAFSNYSTGHVIEQSSAIAAIKINSLQPPANGKQYEAAPARDRSGKLVLLLHDDASGAVYAGTKGGLTALAKRDVSVSQETGQPTAAKGYTLIKGAELFSLDKELQALRIPTHGDAAIQAQGVAQAVELQPTLRYDAAKNRFVRISDGVVFEDNGRGSFVSAANAKDELEPGWKTFIGFHNFGKLANDPLYRNPFLKIFVWTFAYATITVLGAFAIGLFLAITLDKKGLRFQRFYRSALIVPWAIPGFLGLLVWAGLLNDDFGIINRLFGIHVPWLFDANWAKVSVLLVSIWLTTPYFFLVALGALQSIPQELTEAARVDGGSPWGVFRRVTLPLLLVAVAPLMIASFAFNFNNFGNIYFLTQGGPYTGDSSVAGSTDILITYTYKLAIATGKGQDFALASAVAIIIFFIVGAISGFLFYRSKSLENLA
jgi:arabinogalactan oligomer / maltooligosaccharide transport system permease protein